MPQPLGYDGRQKTNAFRRRELPFGGGDGAGSDRVHSRDAAPRHSDPRQSDGPQKALWQSLPKGLPPSAAKHRRQRTRRKSSSLRTPSTDEASHLLNILKLSSTESNTTTNAVPNSQHINGGEMVALTTEKDI